MQIETTKKLDKQYKKLPVKIQKVFGVRTGLFITERNNPFLNIHKLSGNFKGLWSFSVTADIRVIFDSSIDNVVLLIATDSPSELCG